MTVTTFVVDYSYARPSPAAIRGYGAVGVIRYLSGGNSAKDITAVEFSALLAEGFSVALVWEAGPSAALAGRARGVADAAAANAQADAVGFPTSRPIYYAVDFDASTAQIPAVLDYLRGAATGARRVGVYGGIRVIDAVHAAGLADFYWQTAAWSGGHVSAARDLLQATFLTDVDINEVTPGVTDWGQTMASDWLPGVDRVTSTNNGGSMVGGPPRWVWHTYEADPHTLSAHKAALALRAAGNDLHFTFNPLTGDISQILPASVAGRGLQNASGGVETNREGDVCLQCEVIAFAAHPFTDYITAAGLAGWRQLVDFGRSHGIPDVWPAGDPPAYPSGSDPRSAKVWTGKAGHYGHSQVPENTHGDPGAIDTSLMFTEADVPLTDAEIARIWAYQMPNRHTDDPVDTIKAADALGYAHRWTYDALENTKGIAPIGTGVDAANAALVAANAKLDALATAVASLPATILAGIPVTGNGLTKADVLVACETACASAINSTRLITP